MVSRWEALNAQQNSNCPSGVAPTGLLAAVHAFGKNTAGDKILGKAASIACSFIRFRSAV
jgi:hypothetical protein